MEADIGQYEVLQGESFVHLTEPMISFARRAVWINTSCLKRLPDTVYVHFLLFRQTRKLIIKAGVEEAQDVIRWCTPSGKPRKILFDAEFWNDITALMGWSNLNRYRLLGRFVHSSDWTGFAFDMTRAEVFPLDGIKPSLQIPEAALDKAFIPCQTWEDHCHNPLISRFREDTLITIDEVE